jgi:outer membrane protein assembly factor BamB
MLAEKQRGRHCCRKLLSLCASAAFLLTACDSLPSFGPSTTNNTTAAGTIAPAQAAAPVAIVQDQPAPATVGGHVWSSERRDPSGSLRSPYMLPGTGVPVVQWELEFEGGLSGGPAVAADGTLYIGSRAGELHAISADGKALWSVRIPAAPVGSPALNPIGQILVADEQGGVSMIDPTGKLLWRYVAPEGKAAIAGPVIDATGNVYVASDGFVLSLDPVGTPRWRAPAPFAHAVTAPRIKGGNLFFKDIVLSTRGGAQQLPESPDDADQFIAGADGRVYLMNKNALLEWRSGETSNELAEQSRSAWTAVYTYENIIDAMVWTPQLSWALLSEEDTSRVVWIDGAGNALGSYGMAMRDSRMLGVSNNGIQFVCGEQANQQVRCDAIRPLANVPDWSVELSVVSDDGSFGDGPMVAGGALAPESLYIATLTGKLFALGYPPQELAQPPAVADAAITPAQAGFFPPDPTLNPTMKAQLLETAVSVPTATAPALEETATPEAPVATATQAATETPFPTATPTPAPPGSILSAQCLVQKQTVMRNVPSVSAPELLTLQPDGGNSVFLISGASGDEWAYVRVGRRLGWLLLADITCDGI